MTGHDPQHHGNKLYFAIQDDDDPGAGVLRNITPDVEQVEWTHRLWWKIDETVDPAVRRRTAADFTLTVTGIINDDAKQPIADGASGSHSVLISLPGKVVDVEYGPFGNASGQQKIAGDFTCEWYIFTNAEAKDQMVFEAFLAQATNLSITTFS